MDKETIKFNIFMQIMSLIQHTETAIKETQLVMKELFND